VAGEELFWGNDRLEDALEFCAHALRRRPRP
jgi:2-hydroxychromene-2-carboxylate isomerase